jgi:hypothetical protein
LKGKKHLEMQCVGIYPFILDVKGLSHDWHKYFLKTFLHPLENMIQSWVNIIALLCHVMYLVQITTMNPYFVQLPWVLFIQLNFIAYTHCLF